MPSVHFFTDFTCHGPYVGELHGAVARLAPGVNRIDLMHDVPAFNISAGAVLLAQLIQQIPAGDAVANILLCYENAMGLLEVACREGSAACQLGLGVGTEVLRK